MTSTWSIQTQQWAAGALSTALHSHVPLQLDDPLLTTLQASSPTQLRGLLLDLLGNSKETQKLVTELLKRIVNDVNVASASAPSREVAYVKAEADDIFYAGNSKKGKAKTPKTDLSKTTAKPVNLMEVQNTKNSLVPGSVPCKCLAQKHNLLTNCTRCGRIVCEQEGAGPCLTCGHQLFTEEEQQRILKRMKRGKTGLAATVTDAASGSADVQVDKSSDLKSAEAHRNKLLEYDRNSTRRTRVIDDEIDYFSSETNNWLSPEQRELLQKQEKALASEKGVRRSQKMTIDFAGRQVLEESTSQLDEFRRLYESELEKANTSHDKTAGTGFYSNTAIAESPVYIATGKAATVPHHQNQRKLVQHSLQGNSEMEDQDDTVDNDDGICLSMWQPWASLLVAGVKIVEGRSWPITHRGRLWIAAAAKKLPEEETKQVVAEHLASMPKNSKAKSPKYFPTSCLVGCVDVIDCMSAAEYQKQTPAAEQQSESAYVYICANPVQFLVPVPVSGKHKLWSLTPADHTLAKKRLKEASL